MQKDAVNRKSPLGVHNAIGCVLLWIAVMRPDRRTAIKWLRVAIREHNRETTTFMKYHWTLAPNFGCLSFRKSHST
jgi:hypothetical protein